MQTHSESKKISSSGDPLTSFFRDRTLPLYGQTPGGSYWQQVHWSMMIYSVWTQSLESWRELLTGLVLPGLCEWILADKPVIHNQVRVRLFSLKLVHKADWKLQEINCCSTILSHSIRTWPKVKVFLCSHINTVPRISKLSIFSSHGWTFFQKKFFFKQDFPMFLAESFHIYQNMKIRLI